MMKWKSVLTYNFEKVFHFTQNSLVGVALEKKKRSSVKGLSTT